jgi:hypothetical protein
MELDTAIRSRILKDESFRKQFLAEPEAFVRVGSHAHVRVLVDTDQLLHVVIPTQAVAYEPSDDLTKQIVAKAQADVEFRKQLFADPRAIIGETIGVDLPDDLRIVVVADTPRLVHVICPPHERAGVAPTVSAAAVGSTASWGCAVTTADSPCTLEGNSFCTATQGCKTVHGGDPDCQLNPDPGPIEPTFP